MTACTCINGVALHEGHCCLADLAADATMVDCHPVEWTALRDRPRAERDDDRAPLPGQEALL